MRTVRTLAIICLLALPLGAQTTTPNIGLEVPSSRSAAGIIVTFTAAAGTFLNSSGGSATTLVITSGQTCSISTPDNTNYLARCAAARHLAGYTVSTLPSASSLGAGAQVMVTDASTFTVGTCTGGGSDVMIAVSSGSAWSCP